MGTLVVVEVVAVVVVVIVVVGDFSMTVFFTIYYKNKQTDREPWWQGTVGICLRSPSSEPSTLLGLVGPAVPLI